MRLDCLYICPWSLNDPLSQSQSLPYIRGLVSEGYSFALLTLETQKLKLSSDEVRKIKVELARENIHWSPIDWNSGTAIKHKLFGIWAVLSTGIRICFKHKPQLIHSRSSLPAFAAVFLAKMFRLKYLYDADSILSEEYADTGHLSRKSYGFKFLALSEAWARNNADHVIVLTDVLRKDFKEVYDVQTPVEVIPCCVDTQLFSPDEIIRKKRRAELFLSDENLFVYVGKVGSWYQVDETFRFFRIYKKAYSDSKLLIITQDDPISFIEIARVEGVAEEDYFVRKASRNEVSEWLSAADAAFSLIRQVRSKRGSSPVKFAEYLASGLPVITTDGIGDCSRFVLDNNVGVVLKDLSDQTIQAGANYLHKMWLRDHRLEISTRCRKIAENNLSLKSVGHKRYREIYHRLFD